MELLDLKATYFHNFVYGEAPFVNGFVGFLKALVVACFSFSGTEIIGVTAGESATPEESIPKATKQITWRILFFYILTFSVISFILPYDNEKLLNTEGDTANVSPCTLR